VLGVVFSVAGPMLLPLPFAAAPATLYIASDDWNGHLKTGMGCCALRAGWGESKRDPSAAARPKIFGPSVEMKARGDGKGEPKAAKDKAGPSPMRASRVCVQDDTWGAVSIGGW
jgi:hypothetical protein